jgi:hypothetical protein
MSWRRISPNRVGGKLFLNGEIEMGPIIKGGKAQFALVFYVIHVKPMLLVRLLYKLKFCHLSFESALL